MTETARQGALPGIRVEDNLEQTGRILEASHEIGRNILSSSTLDEAVEQLMVAVGQAGLFRSLSFSIVEREQGRIRLLRTMIRNRAGNDFEIQTPPENDPTQALPLGSKDVLAEVVRTGRLLIIEGWDDRFVNAPPDSPLLDPTNYKDKVAYFIPVLKDEEVIAVLGTASTVAERPGVEDRIRTIRPILDQLALAIAHVRLVEWLSGETRRLDALVAKSKRENLALLGIGQHVQEMTRVGDLERVIRGIADSLRDFGLDVAGMTIHRIVDPELFQVESHHLRPDGAYQVGTRALPTTVAEWQDGVTLYWPNIRKDPGKLGTAYRPYAAMGIEIHSVVTVPYGNGTITLRSERINAFGQHELDLIGRIGNVLSIGISRAADFEKMAHRAVEVLAQQKRLQEEKEFSDSLIASMREGFCILSPEGHLLDVNPALCEMTGFSRDELVGAAPPHPFWPREQARRMRALMLRAARGGLRDYELLLVRKDGSRFPAVISPSRTPKTESRDAAYFATIRDITEEREIQIERAQAQRLRTIGELSAGVSHNLNNILTSILGPAQLLKMKTDDPNLISDVEMIHSSATRAADLVKRLSRTTQNEGERLGPVDLALAIEEAVRDARPRWQDEAQAHGARIEVRKHIAETPPIRGTQSGLHDMLLNLIFNAVDAMPEGGTLDITTGTRGSRVTLTVRDTGIGMSESTRRRVFEPFFTTKMDVGSGLGLSTLFGTLRAWHGSVEVSSERGRGSEFRLQFPRWEDEERPTPESSLGTPLASTAPAVRVLIVDDDPLVGQFLTNALARHRVRVEKDPRQALAAFEAQSCDVILIDLGMPGMSGDTLARSIRERDPAVPLVMITGWDLPPDDPRNEPFDFTLRKPFDSIDSIERTLDKALHLHGTGSTGGR